MLSWLYFKTWHLIAFVSLKAPTTKILKQYVQYSVLNHYWRLVQGTMECILAAAISGVLFALFSGQPLNILGSTGPMLVLEAILYTFCRYVDISEV